MEQFYLLIIAIIVITGLPAAYVYHYQKTKYEKELADCHKRYNDPIGHGSYLQFVRYSGWNPVEKVQTSDLAKKSSQNMIMKLSIVERNIHIVDYVVNADKTFRIISEKYCLPFDKTYHLTDQEYNKILEWKEFLEKNRVHCCPDGEPGDNQFITIAGQKPMYVYGSCMVNEAQKVSQKFIKFCWGTATKILSD